MTTSSGATFTLLGDQLTRLATDLAQPTGLKLAAGARVVITAEHAEALSDVPDMLTERAITVLDGPPGAGKTLLLRLLIARASQLQATGVRVQAGRRPSGKALSQAIHSGIAPGQRVPRTQTATEDSLRRLLAAPAPFLVIYDEADKLGVHGIEDVRYYWDETPGQFPLVLGGNDVSAVLAAHPQLTDRVLFRYTLRELAPADSVRFACLAHPLLADAHRRDPQLLPDIDAALARGGPRRWNAFVIQAQRHLRRWGREHLDDEIAYRSLARLPGADLDAWRRDAA